MKTLISKLRTMFPAKDFIITGSYVLAEYGLMSMKDVHDIDVILVNPEPSTIEALNRWMKDSPAPSTAKLKVLPVPEVKEPERKHNDLSEDEEDDIVYAKAMSGRKVMKAEVRQSHLQAIFMFDKTKVDIYIENTFSEPTLLVDGVKYTTIPHIIKAKRSYGRMKDWLQCRDMSRVLFNPNEYVEMLNSNWKSTLREEY
jgi:hypothetical protein